MKSLLQLFCILVLACYALGCTPEEKALSDAEQAKKEMEEAAKKGSGPVQPLPPHEEKKKEEAKKGPSPAPESEETGPGGGDWHEWGRNGSNNMMSPAKNIPSDFTSGEMGDNGEVLNAKHAKWVIEMGSQAYGTPTIKDGRVYVGTNNEKPRLASIQGDHGIVMCFDEKTGELIWQFAVPKLGAGKVSDWEFLGVCSSIALDGKYGYVVTNRGEVICLDVYGLSDGNEGFQDEAKYLNGGLEKLNESEPAELDPKDADIVWGFDMRSELGVFPHNITSSSVVIAGDYIFAATSNGVDWSHINIPAPYNPAIVALDKGTGELVAEEDSGISQHIMHCNWSSPAYSSDLNGKPTVVFGAGDGICYGFNATEFIEEDDGGEIYRLLKENWKVDVCPVDYRYSIEAQTEGLDKKVAEPIEAMPEVASVEITEVDKDRDRKPDFLKLTIAPAILTDVEADDPLADLKSRIGELSKKIAGMDGIVSATSANESAIKYATYPGPSEVIASPVVYNNKVYVGIGQDPEHGEGVGCLTCIDPSKGNGVDAIVWQFKELGRTISTPSIVDGLLYIADYSGRLFCLDAETGEKYWEHDTLSHIWGSTLVVDGKVLLGNEDGELVILKAGKEYEELNTIGYPAPIYSTPVVANGVLYVMTQTHLYAYSADSSLAKAGE